MGIIEQTYRSRRAKYWKLTLDPDELKQIICEIREVVSKHGLDGLCNLFRRYLGKDTLETFLESLVGQSITQAAYVAAFLMGYLAQLDAKEWMQMLVLLHRLATEGKLELDLESASIVLMERQ